MFHLVPLNIKFYQHNKMSRIFLTTLSLLLLLQLAASFAADEQPVNNKLPFGFHSLFPFLGREEDVNRDVNEPKEQVPVDPQIQPQLGITNPSNLREDFYLKSCPNAEKIVTDAFAEIYKQNPGAIGNFLRLQFHDCFVNVSFSKQLQIILIFLVCQVTTS